MNRVTKLNKDKKFRRKFFMKELKILANKYCLFSLIDDRKKMFYLYKFAQMFHLDWSGSRIVSRCIYTGRARWVLRKYRLSRMIFKNMCSNGNIHGTRRSSW